MRHLPNLLTCLRLALVLPVAWLLLRQQYPQALWLFLLAGLSDALDGLLARRFGWTSRLGAWLDPIADKLLLVISYVCLTLNGLVPVWLTAVLLLRDLVIVGGAGAFAIASVRSTSVRPGSASARPCCRSCWSWRCCWKPACCRAWARPTTCSCRWWRC